MRKFLAILLLVGLSGFSGLSYGEDKPLIVGSEQDYPPFALGLTDATADGFTVELWRAVAAENRLNWKIRVLPFHQVLTEFKAGKIDVLINLAQSDERRQFVDFTVPHVVVHGAIFVRNTEDNIYSEADLKNKKIIVLNADLAHDYAVSKGWGKQLVLVDTLEQGFELLAAGQDEVMLLSKLAGQQTLEKLKIRNVKMLPIKVRFAQKFSFAVQKGNADLLAKLNEGLALVKANGIYDRLYEKWFGVYEEPDLYPLLLKFLAPIVATFLLFVSVILYRRGVERKQALLKLQKSEARFRMMADSAPTLIWIAGVDGRCMWFNKVWLDFTGRTMAQELDRGWEENVHSEDLQDFLDCYLSHFICHEAFRMEYRCRRYDGEYRWLINSGVPLFDQNDEFSGFIGSCIDITERKQMETALLRSHRDLTGFAEISSHHLMEPTRRLNSYTQRLTRLFALTAPTYPLAQEINTCLDFLRGDANRLHEMVRDIQRYLSAAEPRGVLQMEEVSGVLTQIKKWLQLGFNASNTTLVLQNLPLVFLDRPRLFDLFSLIIDNALSHGQPTQADVAAQIVVNGERIGKTSRYVISDNGAGIPPEYHNRVFEIFERLGHDKIAGSGVGLAIARRIVESRHGQIWIENSEPFGTRVIFELPDGESIKHDV